MALKFNHPKWRKEVNRIIGASQGQADQEPKTWRYRVIIVMYLLRAVTELPAAIYRFIKTGSFKKKPHPFWKEYRKWFEETHGAMQPPENEIK